MGKKRIVVVVISELVTDQRVIRISNTLVQMGFEVTVIARRFKNSLELDRQTFEAERIYCSFKKGVLQYAEFNLKLLLRLLRLKTDYYLANDLDVLAPAYLVSKLKRKHLFYDTHEYFTGVPELSRAHLKRKCWKLLEDFIFPRLKTVYTVNESIRKLYHEEYGNQIAVIRNVPVTVKEEASENSVGWPNRIVLLMQGAGINEGRGGLELLTAMKYLPQRYLLLFIGGGNQWAFIKDKVVEWGLQDKVLMMEKMKPSLLRQYTSLAQIGFSLDSFEDLNCLYNLPNKIFDYIHAKLPIIATAIPEVKKVIEQYECGICINSNDPVVIAKTIEDMTGNRILYERFKENCAVAAKELCWEKESVKLTAIYQPYL